MQDIWQKFTNIKGKLDTYVLDKYLLTTIDTPVIDDDKLLILVSIMEFLELPYNKLENLALSTMLIQTALDTHEHISRTSEDEKKRQLTVLAGDYYSGLYYKLLADSEEIFMIDSLSNGVKEVNEYKVSVYHKESDSVETLIKNVKMLESALLERFTSYFKADLWSESAANLLLFKRLLNEKKLYLQKEGSIVFDAIMNLSNFSSSNDKEPKKQQLIKICDHYLDCSKQIVENGMNKIPFLNELLRSRISSLLKQHQPYAETFMEEG
ncbi:heptaprenyl diphosphate synthase component 1 [Neobacillus mesonae]|uniref:heptaprenyl diphosphate synthase component 1 n=1 Tax=Neobacillus mesonae TaxID=1193713 RepID=UPI00203E418D|nr:heptaprenyl diphosphate synthase component 1 [Neobacillus mesonae]MCM3566784.1 heptaprenyl diphosphate synthase component 1 [Neobacillus mesonae]